MASGEAQAGQPGPEARVRVLAEQAGSLARRGELPQALALYQQILEVEPAHPEAVSFVAMSLLQGGDLRRALAMLSQAAERHGENANLHKNLGIAFRASGDPAKALAAFERAFTLQPAMVAAWLNHGALLAELRREEEALSSYLRGFEAAEATGMLVDAARIPAGIRVLAEKAWTAIRDARMEVFQRALAPLEREHGRPALARVWHCLEAYLGLRPQVQLPAGQRPTFMSFPGLPARAWYEHDEFPWMPELERHTGVIREELLAVMAKDEGFRPFVEMPREHPGAEYWKQLNHSPDWNAFFFYRDGEAYAANQARCPATVRALEAAPLNRVADHSPEALYSILTPHAHIPPHTGVINIRLVVHLPLIVPSATECGIRVGTETRGWREGRCIAFDDTYEHEAWNRSSHTRVVLIFDIWNPALTLPERDAMRVAIEELGRFNRAHGDTAKLIAGR